MSAFDEVIERLTEAGLKTSQAQEMVWDAEMVARADADAELIERAAIRILDHPHPGDDVPQFYADLIRELAAAGKASPTGPTAARLPLTIYRASHEEIVFGLYTTAQAAREHCEAYARNDSSLTGLMNWVLDEPAEADSIEELTVGAVATSYVVTPLTVDTAFDEEADV